jgi:hypothetical protein
MTTTDTPVNNGDNVEALLGARGDAEDLIVELTAYLDRQASPARA